MPGAGGKCGRHLPLLRRRLRDHRGRGAAAARQLCRPYPARALRRHCCHHAVELAADHGGAEDRAGAGGRQRGAAETIGGDARRRADRGAAGAGSRAAAGPAAGIAGQRRGNRRRPGRARESAHDLLHRRHQYGPRYRPRRGRSAGARSTRAWRQVAQHRLRRRRSRCRGSRRYRRHLRGHRPVLRCRLAPVRRARHLSGIRRPRRRRQRGAEDRSADGGRRAARAAGELCAARAGREFRRRRAGGER